VKRLLTIAFLLAAARSHAQPAAPAPGGDKVDAKQLMQTGVKLLEAKDYLGALAIFKDAYVRFPSPKILLNIGTTLKLLDRKAEAANVYERYLASNDADPAKRAEVSDAISELDKWLGRITITLDPQDAEIEVDGDWLKGSRIVHVNPGGVVVHARKDGFQPAERNVSLVGGQQVALAIKLVEAPKVVDKPVVITTHDERPAVVEEGPRSRIGAVAMAHVSVVPKVGSAWAVGATADVTPQLAVDAAVLLGPGLVSSSNMYTINPPKIGAYAGASFAFLPAPFRPRVAVAMPIFYSSSSLRFSIRGAGGFEYVASRHLSIVVEIGVEHPLNPENDIEGFALVPALAATGRL
jgi:hypothetical protein